MLYVSHPCADMISGFMTILWETDNIIRTPRMRFNNNTNICTHVYFNLRDDSTDGWNEDTYESEVVERNVLSKFKIERIDEHIFEQCLNKLKTLYVFICTV